MTRNANGILTLAVFLSLFAPGFRGGSSGAGPLTKVETGGEKPAAADVSESRKEEGYQIKSNSYQADVLRLVQRSLSTGLQLDADKNLSCPMDDLRKPGITQETVHVVIALAPDPVHTNLPSFFDRQMDALEQAAQDCGWIFDEAVMPWDNRSHCFFLRYI